MEIKPLSDKAKERDCLIELQRKIKDDEYFDNLESILDERFLLHFIRGKKHNTEYAYKTLRQYMHIRKEKYRDLFITFIPSKIYLANCFAVRPLKGLGAEGQTFVVSRVEWWPPPEQKSDQPLEDIALKLLQWIEEMWMNENMELNGLEVILELSSCSLGHAKILCNPTGIVKIFNIFYKSMPVRYRKIHYVNPPIYFKMAHRFVKPFAPKKLLDRVQIHNEDCQSLHDHIDPSILPKFLNGHLNDEDEAFDMDFHKRTHSPEKDAYYKQFIEKL